MLIREIRADHYRIPLPVALSDSTHGTMTDFELVTVRMRDDDGAEGVGYTYTVGTGGARRPRAGRARSGAAALGRDADRIEALWQAMWWALHYGGRGGAQVLAISAVDIALWDLRARRLGTPLWRLLGGFDPRVPCYAGGIDLDFPLDALLGQTDDNLARGFRAIKMKVGRPALARTSSACAPCARPRRRLPADGRRQHALERRRGGPGRARLRRAEPVWLEEPTIPDDVPGHARIVREGGVPSPPARTSTRSTSSGSYRRRRRDVPRARCDQLRRCHRLHEGLASGRGVQPAGHLARRARLTVHLLAAVPNRSYLEAHGFGLDRFIAEPLRSWTGATSLPIAPATASTSTGRASTRCRRASRGPSRTRASRR